LPVRNIVRIPNSILKQVSTPVAVSGEEASLLARDLIDTMRAHPHCVGLAAPQIGVNLRAFVVDVSEHPKASTSHGEVALLNPEIVESHEPEMAREGCMSVPDLTGDVSRATRLVVRGLNLEGEVRTLELEGFEARAFQHEIDHLDGLLFLDRVQSHHGIFRRKTYR
jgi:peptide deformylase